MFTTAIKKRPNGIKGSTKLIRQCKCPCMKRMKASVCSCLICERAREALRRYHKYRVGWRLQEIDRRKREIAEEKKKEGMSDRDIKVYLGENPTLFQCQKCNGKCHEGSVYQTFSASLSTCMNALLCAKVRVPPYDLPKLDINLRGVPGEMDQFEIHPEECCYGSHCQLDSSNKQYSVCGWDATFKDMPLHEREEKEEEEGVERNKNTRRSKKNETIVHQIRACPDEYDRDGKVTWMDFVKVARSEEKTTNDDEDYERGNGVKFQTKFWHLAQVT